MPENNPSSPALDKAFEALKTYAVGSARGPLMPIDEAVAAASADAAARAALEPRLLAALQSQVPPAAKEYICRKLAVVGSAKSAPALAELLLHKDLGHLARLALESIPTPEALRALRESLPHLAGLPKAGVIQSLGMRRDPDSVPALAASLADPDAQVAAAAAAALGNIGNLPAAQALQKVPSQAPAAVRNAVADGLLACAEALDVAGRKTDALAIYKTLSASEHPKHVKLAATRGLLLGAQK